MPLGHPVVVAAAAVVAVEVLSHPTMCGVVFKIGALPEPWESENTLEEVCHS